MQIHGKLTLALALAAVAGCDAGPDARPDARPEARPGAAPTRAPVDAAVPPAAGPEPSPPGRAAGLLVPDAFHGRYAIDAGACGQPGHPTRLEIGGDRIAFHESSGPVLRAEGEPAGLAITAELTGEGETRQATYRFRLAADGSAITDLDGGLARVRCD